jgi:hypothetical protein
MNVSPKHAEPNPATPAVVVRRGTTMIELLVSFSLLITVLGVSAPLVVRHGRILVSADHYRLALDELTNQLERLRALPAKQAPEELEDLKPSDLTTQRLVGAKLEGKLEEGENGRRVRLQIYWDEPQRRESPVELVGWLRATDATAPAEAAGPRSQP